MTDAAPQAPSVQQAERFTSYEVNILNGVADWLETRSYTVWARGNHDGLMRTWAKDLRDILAAQPSERPAPAGDWKQAIDDELVTLESTADSYPNAKAAVKALIDWHVSVALDPAVSSDAQALIDKGMALVAAPAGQLREALEEIVDPIAFMKKRLKEGQRLEGHFAYSLSRDSEYLKGIARAALASSQAERPAEEK